LACFTWMRRCERPGAAVPHRRGMSDRAGCSPGLGRCDMILLVGRPARWSRYAVTAFPPVGLRSPGTAEGGPGGWMSRMVREAGARSRDRRSERVDAAEALPCPTAASLAATWVPVLPPLRAPLQLPRFVSALPDERIAVLFCTDHHASPAGRGPATMGLRFASDISVDQPPFPCGPGPGAFPLGTRVILGNSGRVAHPHFRPGDECAGCSRQRGRVPRTWRSTGRCRGQQLR